MQPTWGLGAPASGEKVQAFVAEHLPVDREGETQAPSGRAPATSVQTDDPGTRDDSASWVGTFLSARAGTIDAGSSEIQRNIIGEMVLGLSKEPRPEGAGASWKASQQRS